MPVGHGEEDEDDGVLRDGVRDEDIEFDSQDEEECEDLFAGVQTLDERQGARVPPSRWSPTKNALTLESSPHDGVFRLHRLRPLPAHGEVLNVAGPGLAVVAFLLATSVFWCVVSCLGEMTALFPIQGPLFEFPARYLDDAVGYAVGWMAWFSWAVTISSQALAVAARTIIYFNFGT
ncbi:amino acid permease [Paraphaeosphaeria sporulosa]